MKIKKKIVALTASLMMVITSLTSCAIFKGDPNDRSVTYEISEDKKSVTFFATADSRAFARWSFKNEDAAVVKAESEDWSDKGFCRVSMSKRITGGKEGQAYVAFYIPSSKQQYTIIFGYNVSVDALGQLTVEEAESDSMIGKESQD